MSTRPALSVILPNYNHADYLDRCITAVLDQSFKDLEFVIVDDGSTDASVAVIQKYARVDPRVRFYQNDRNRGVIYTLNRALSYATAEYVLGAASDDYVLPGYFEAAFDLLKANPGAGIALGLCATVNDDGHLLAETPGLWAEEPMFMDPADVAGRITNCGVPGPVIWHRQAFHDAGAYIPELRWHGDWFTLQVVAFRRGVCFLPFRTSVVRHTPQAYSAGQARMQTQRQVLRHMLGLIGAEKYRDVLPYFVGSWVLLQFGTDLVKAAMGIPDPSPAVLAALRRYAFAHANNLLHDPIPEVRAGIAALLGRYGREAFEYLERLERLGADRNPKVAAAAAAARSAVWRSLSPPAQIGRA
ncbi:MAG: glycosyltransferase family 2 protein, partial [Gemmataceae bacterium]|nr:glycosyltransferase family 2 protein [Gemmataceae bacterium]